VTHIRLTRGVLSYTTFDAIAIDRLRIAPSFLRTDGPPLVVTAAGQSLPRINVTDLRHRGAVGWAFDDASGVLDVAHNASDVCVLGSALA
jgi:hypothetical protein